MALFFILIILTCAVLAFFVLIQNPKGGGLAGSFSGLGTQMMGAKQSTDAVEKATWIASACLLVFVLVSFVMSPKGNENGTQKTRSEQVNRGAQSMPAAPKPAPAQAPAPAPAQGQGQSAPAQSAPAPQGN